MEVFKGRPLQSMQLHQPLNLQPSHSLMKRSVLSVSSDYSVRCGKFSLPTTSSEVPSSMQHSLEGTAVKKVRLMNDSLRKTELKLSNKFLENLSILKGFKTSDVLDKTNTQKLANTTDQGALRTKSSILKGWHVVLDLEKSSFKERLDLKNEILSHGGTVAFSVTKKTTHLLVEGISKRSFSFKRHCAQKYGVKVVSVDYVRDCLESGSVLSVEPYIAADKVEETENKENNLLSGKIKALGKQREVLQEKPEKSMKEEPFIWEDFESKAEYQIAKFCFMKDLNKESPSRCLLVELHVLTEPTARRYRIYCQFLLGDKSVVEKCFSLSSSLQAVAAYCKVTKSLQPMFSITDVKSEKFGSPKFQKMQMETHTISADKLSTSVKTLVDIVWKVAIGTASASVDITSVTTEKVNKAAVTLAQIKRMLVEEGATEKQLEDKSKQFYSQICHKGTNHDAIDTKRKINQMQELCMLLQDVMNVQEASDWKKNVNITNKYRSLRCNIQSVDTYSSQYQTVMRIIGKEAMESSRIQVTNVYSLTRPLEDSIFAPKGRKVTSLVHATRPTSLLGILSRGLLPPKIVQEDVGIERRDYGFLGQGIYFGDDIRSNMHFTEPNGCTKTRFLLMCEVIVGKQYKTCQHQPDLVNPPPGYDSVLGVKNSDGNHSMFKHNEYTIYDVGQQRLSYLIEFVQVNETPVIYQPEFSTEDVEEPSVEEKNKEIDVSDVMDVSDPLDKVTPGLQTSGGQPVLLERVSVKAKMMDLVAQVTVFQRYRNTNTKPIEAKYVFPLDDTAAVCGFEAFIGDKHIVGEVKEKETAHKEYREAVSQGHGAYLMDEESADVFTVSVGNLPPSTEVIIKIIYVVELSLDDDHIVFHLPGSLASWRKEGALAEETQNVTSTVSTGDEKIKFEMSLSMEMPFDIQTIKCSTHDIKVKRTAAKACITLAEGEDCLKEGFHLSVKLHKIHQPHMWVEQNPNDKDSQACMLTFYPEFEVPQLKKPDVTVILDCSNSMKGESFEHAKKVCYMIASLMPKNYRFNLVKFGTNFKEFYPASRLSSKIDFDELKDFLAGASPAEGNTDVWRPLHSHYLLEGENLRNVLIISDGHINNETETLKSIAKNSSHTRIFTFGVSTTCNKHMLKIMARSGAGSFEFFDGKTKSAWQRKVKNQLRRAGQPSVNSLSVKWHQFDNYAPKPRQAPRHLGALFSGSRLVVFGIVPYCTSATLTAVIDGQEISTVVSTSDLCITKGLTLHRLTARALIRDWEDGMLDMDRIEEEIAKEKEKQAIISLSRQYSIVTSLTSFVAIEKREKHEVQRKSNMEEKLKELLQMEDVDVLPYMDWQLRQEMTIDFNDKDKWDKEARKYEDGMHDDEPSSSDEESIENLPSADHEIMDYAEEVIRHFDGEDSTSSESDSSSSVCYYSDKLGGKLKEVETSDDEEEDTMSFDLGLAEELYDDILYSAAVLRTDSFSSELEELGTNLKEVDTSDDEKEYTMSFDLGPSEEVPPADTLYGAAVPATASFSLELEEESFSPQTLESESFIAMEMGDKEERLLEVAMTSTLGMHDKDEDDLSRGSHQKKKKKKKGKEDPLDQPAKWDKPRKRQSRSRSRDRESEVSESIMEEKETEESSGRRYADAREEHSPQPPQTPRMGRRRKETLIMLTASPHKAQAEIGSSFTLGMDGSSMVDHSGGVSAASASQKPPPSPPQMFDLSAASASLQLPPSPSPRLFGSSPVGARVQQQLPPQPAARSFGFSATSVSQHQSAPPSLQMFDSSEESALHQQQQHPPPSSSQMFGFSLASASQEQPPRQPPSLFGSFKASASRESGRYTSLTESLLMDSKTTSLSHTFTPPPSKHKGLFGSSFAAQSLKLTDSSPSAASQQSSAGPEIGEGGPLRSPPRPVRDSFTSPRKRLAHLQVQSLRSDQTAKEGSMKPEREKLQTDHFKHQTTSQESDRWIGGEPPPPPPLPPPPRGGGRPAPLPVGRQRPRPLASAPPPPIPPSHQGYGSSLPPPPVSGAPLPPPLPPGRASPQKSSEFVPDSGLIRRGSGKREACLPIGGVYSPMMSQVVHTLRDVPPPLPAPRRVRSSSSSPQKPATSPAKLTRGGNSRNQVEQGWRQAMVVRSQASDVSDIQLANQQETTFKKALAGSRRFQIRDEKKTKEHEFKSKTDKSRIESEKFELRGNQLGSRETLGSEELLERGAVPYEENQIEKNIVEMHNIVKSRSVANKLSHKERLEGADIRMKAKRRGRRMLREPLMAEESIKLSFIPRTEEILTDEPGVDSKFELFKVPQLRKLTDQTSVLDMNDAAVKLCQKMHGKCFAKHEEVLELLGIPEKTFLEFFRHVGIYSLGKVAAEAFLTFFTTWLVYVFIDEVVKKAAFTDRVIQSSKAKDTLAQMKSWLNEQGSQYSVKDYYLGFTSWNEVAREMLGFTMLSTLV